MHLHLISKLNYLRAAFPLSLWKTAHLSLPTLRPKENTKWNTKPEETSIQERNGTMFQVIYRNSNNDNNIKRSAMHIPLSKQAMELM